MGIIEAKNKRLVVIGKKLPKGDVDIITKLLIGPKSAFKLMEETGKLYVQYVQYRLRVLKSLGVVLGSEERGVYEINPELVEDLKNAIEEIKKQIEEEKAKKTIPIEVKEVEANE